VKNAPLRWLRSPPNVADGKRHKWPRRSANCPGSGTEVHAFDASGSSHMPADLPG